MNASFPSDWPGAFCCSDSQYPPALCKSFPVAASLSGHRTKARPGSPQVISVVFLKLIVLVPRLPALVAPEDDESRMTSKISVLLKHMFHLFARQGALYRVLDYNANARYEVARCGFGLLTND